MKRKLLKRYKKKRGFTLIELLAVILILGIIALIAIPTVSSVVEESRRGAAKTSAQNYIRAVSQQIITNELDDSHGRIIDDVYFVSNLTTLGVEVKGTKPTDLSKVTISSGEVSACELYVNGYLFICKGDDFEISKLEKEAPEITVKVNVSIANITITDNEGVIGYSITEEETEDITWTTFEKTKKYEFEYAAIKPHTFHIYATDYSGNISHESFVIESSAFNYAATVTQETYEATLTCANGRTLSGENCTYYYASNADKCGKTQTGSTYSCCKKYKTCSVGTTVKQDASCGCNYTCASGNYQTSGSYKGQCLTYAGAATCSPNQTANSSSRCVDSECARTSGTPDRCPVIGEMSYCHNGKINLGGTTSCYTASSATCSSYKSCEVANAPSENAACGCETYGTCGSNTYTNNSCTITENEYKKYTCESGDTLSGTTCTHNVYSCPNGGTLSGTTCIKS